ncbi:MAG: glycosyltransferase family 4 protein [Acidobacteria bacterium]|nr:glycosyltransferase family 4 protein [Acidobacteriota bacterium]
MKVAMLSKALVVGAYHSKLAELAALPDVDLAAIVPPAWRDERGEIRLELAKPIGPYQLIVTPIRFNGSFHLHYYPQFDRLLEQLKPDIVHIDEEPYNLATWLALRAARRVGARTLFFSWQNLNRRYPFPFSAIERQVLSQADICLAGNQAARQVWRAKGYRGPIEVIPQFGVDPTEFSPIDSPRADRFVIGYAGRLITDKGLDLLLRALARLTGSWCAVILGSGPERERLGVLAQQLNIQTRVDFKAWLPSAQLPAFYRALDVLVLPSRSQRNWQEQFGRTLVEAMACGVPVVGSTCGEIPNVIGDAGLIFPEEDAAALSAQLQRLQQDAALRQRLAQRGRQRVLDHFTQAQVARRTVDVYRRLMRIS